MCAHCRTGGCTGHRAPGRPRRADCTIAGRGREPPPAPKDDGAPFSQRVWSRSWRQHAWRLQLPWAMALSAPVRPAQWWWSHVAARRHPPRSSRSRRSPIVALAHCPAEGTVRDRPSRAQPSWYAAVKASLGLWLEAGGRVGSEASMRANGLEVCRAAPAQRAGQRRRSATRRLWRRTRQRA